MFESRNHLFKEHELKFSVLGKCDKIGKLPELCLEIPSNMKKINNYKILIPNNISKRGASK